jgi:hypothetical protein
VGNSKNTITQKILLHEALGMMFLFLLTNPFVIYFITPNKYCDDLKLSLNLTVKTKPRVTITKLSLPCKMQVVSVLYCRPTSKVIFLLLFKQVMISTRYKHTISCFFY